jgi:P27 family predicted phage terminase small subunit
MVGGWPMGKRGPPPKPAYLKLLAGNPGKRKINRREPRPAPGQPSIPSWLSGAAKSEWRRVWKAVPPGLITKLDRYVFAQYCQNVARMAELEKILTEVGYTFVTDKGYVVQRPELGMLKGLQSLTTRLCGELGLTPSSRGRIELPPDAEKEGTEDFLFGRRARPPA